MPSFASIKKSIERGAKKLRYNWREYDLWKEIFDHEWVRKGNPSRKAIEWYRKDIMNDSDYYLRGSMLRQGMLYMYDYDHPKHEDILDYFDTQPLVISIGSIDTSLGKRDLGLNLHLLPPRIRKVLMHQVFEMYRTRYKEQMFTKDQKPVFVRWKDIVNPLHKFGVEFCIRMYIPELRKNTIEFKYEDWANAVYIESKGYTRTSVEQLAREWANFIHASDDRKKHLSESWAKS